MSRYRLWQDGMIVASVEAEDDDRAQAEIRHYATVYSQDGPVKVEVHHAGRWRAFHGVKP